MRIAARVLAVSPRLHKQFGVQDERVGRAFVRRTSMIHVVAPSGPRAGRHSGGDRAGDPTCWIHGDGREVGDGQMLLRFGISGLQ